MEKVILDSSVIIEYLRKKRKERLKTLFFNLNQKENFSLQIPFICVAELYGGESTRRETVATEISKIISGLEIIFPDFEILVKAGKLFRDQKIKLPDAFIAAIALRDDSPLATLNLGDFQKIPNLKIHKS